MSKDIRNLEPKALWENFYKITQIPHPSNHEEAIQEFAYNLEKNWDLKPLKMKLGT